jgi:hypothetical protein
MCALGKQINGQWELDPNEPPFTQSELEEALRMRKLSLSTPTRHDNCPHRTPCPAGNVLLCIENIAWFLRYSKEINEIDPL